jgi:glutathione S-transferase
VAFVTVDVPAGAHRTPAFLALNPAGTVPVLELDDGTTIAECTAITEYLDHLDGAPMLTGCTARERGLIHMVNRRAEADVLDAVAAFFHHATPGLGPAIEGRQNPEWGDRNQERALAGMHYLDAVLQGRAWLAGDVFSMADITAYAGMAFADFVGLGLPQRCAHLLAWRERVGSRPATRRVAG